MQFADLRSFEQGVKSYQSGNQSISVRIADGDVVRLFAFPSSYSF